MPTCPHLPAVPPTRLHLLRDIVAENIGALAERVTNALQNAGYGDIPIFLTVPSGGTSFMTFGTPSDPPVDVWEAVAEIVCTILQSELKTSQLTARDIACAAAGMPFKSTEAAEADERLQAKRQAAGHRDS